MVPSWRPCWASPLGCLLVLLACGADEPSGSIVFKLGTVLQETFSAQCPGTIAMHLGHKLATDRLNEGIGHGEGGHVTELFVKDAQGSRHRIFFNYTRYEASCDEGEHSAQVERAIGDGAHFLLGNTHFAFTESAIANNAQRLVHYCCPDTDELFDLDYKYVYGVAGSVKKDTHQALTAMALDGSIRRLFVYYTEDFRYATVTCTAAIEHTTSMLSQLNPDFKIVSVMKYSSQNVTSAANFFDSVVAEEAVRAEADAVVGCDGQDAGIQTAKAFARRKYYLKALFLTWAPLHSGFVSSVGGPEAANHILTVAHWHPIARGLADTFFGTPVEYAAAFEKEHGFQPDQLHAVASATVLSLAWAIQAAFERCTFVKPSMDAASLLFDPNAIECVDSLGAPLPQKPIGYDLVLKSLAAQSVTTFFGKIEFNRFRRNIAARPLIIQVQSGVNQVVLPVEQASKKIIMPVPRPVSSEESSLIGVLEVDTFIAVVVIVVVAALLLLAAALLLVSHRRMRRQHADRVKSLLVILPEHLQVINLPVHLMDGSWESGKAMLRNSLVALEPLSEVMRAKMAGDSNDPSNTGKNPLHHLMSLGGGTPKRQVSISSPETFSLGWRSSGTTIDNDVEAVYPQDLEHHKPSITQLSNRGSQSPCAIHPSIQIDSMSAHRDVSHLGRACEKQPQQASEGNAISCSQVLDLVWCSKNLQHPSVVPVTGIVWSLPGTSSNMAVLVTECQELGTLTSVMDNHTMELDFVKQVEVAKDLASALAYLHAQDDPQVGQALPYRLSGVMLNKHCRAKLRVPLIALLGTQGSSQKPPKPDVVMPGMKPEASQHELADVFQFGMGVAGMFSAGRSSSSQLSCSNLKTLQQTVEGCALTKSQFHELQFTRGPGMAQLLRECCALDARKRPCFTQICKRLEDAELEMIRVAQQAACQHSHSAPQLHLHNKQSADKLLYELFPAKVAEALKNGQFPDPEPYPCVSLFFSDIVGYTDICSKLATQHVMDMLHRLYSRFDDLATERGLFKVETIGDAYMCAGNLRHPQPDTHAALMADFAFGCCAAANEEPVCLSRPDMGFIHIRVGIHTGPVTGAVVGTLNRRFCLFGDCVNVASRMESTSTKDHVQCSAAFKELLQQQWPEAASLAEPQEAKLIKGKGIMHTFYLYPPQKAHAAIDASNPPSGPGLQAPPLSSPFLKDAIEGW
uniref:Guanylate cyclase domain-containing protein n=1 Tax=Dunaliella tertiolecta TaxID=3047 RepID=A0A7S3R6K8_DUNTE